MVLLAAPSKHYHSLHRCIVSGHNVKPAIFHQVTITFMENEKNTDQYRKDES